jgi:hypothetical protein
MLPSTKTRLAERLMGMLISFGRRANFIRRVRSAVTKPRVLAPQ